MGKDRIRTIRSFLLAAILLWAFPLIARPGDRSEPLPAWETEEETFLRKLFGFPPPTRVDAPPTGEVESYAEWAPAEGVIITWMDYTDFLTDLVAEFVQVGTCWIVVENAAEQTTVMNHLQGEGIPLDNVE